MLIVKLTDLLPVSKRSYRGPLRIAKANHLNILQLKIGLAT